MILRVFWSYGSKCPMVMLSAKSLDSKFWKVAKRQLICQFHKSSIRSEPHGSKRSSNSMWMLWCQSMPYHAMLWHHKSSWGKVWVFRVNWDFFLNFFGFLSEIFWISFRKATKSTHGWWPRCHCRQPGWKLHRQTFCKTKTINKH